MIKDILNRFDLLEEKVNEDNVNVGCSLEPQEILDIINAGLVEDLELEENDKLYSIKVSTMYNDYYFHGITTESYYIIPEEDYKQFVRDLASQFSQCLPDDFDYYFNCESLEKDILADSKNYYLYNTIIFINKNDEDANIDMVEYCGSHKQDDTNYIIVRI